jgi:molybdenum cofactor guanylyltransferase
VILHPRITGVVLAGGRARRMGGANKAMLPVEPGSSQTTLDRILALFEDRFAGCVLVTAARQAGAPEAGDPAWYAGLPVRVTADRYAGCGPLGGLHAGLSAVTTPFAFVCGCDMPSLSGPLIDLMARRARDGRLLVPVVRGRPEPLHAIYPISCLIEVERALGEGVRMMLDFFERVPVDYLSDAEFSAVEGAERSFMNINTPEDLAAPR